MNDTIIKGAGITILDPTANGPVPLVTGYFISEDTDRSTYLVDFKTGQYRLVWDINEGSWDRFMPVRNPELVFVPPTYYPARKITTKNADNSVSVRYEKSAGAV